MTSGTVAGLNVSHTRSAPAEDSDQVRGVTSPLPSAQRSSANSAVKASSSSSSTAVNGAPNGLSHKARNGNGIANGHAANAGDESDDESEAETEILDLSDADKDRPNLRTKNSLVKQEDGRDGDSDCMIVGSRRSPNSPRHSRKNSDVYSRRSNGMPEATDVDRIRPRHSRNGLTNEEGTTGGPSSRASGTLGKPPHLPSLDTNTRTASSSTNVSPIANSPNSTRASTTRKRKISEEHHLSNIEHPRQRVKSDHSAKSQGSTGAHSTRNQPTSPTAISPARRSHRRSESTQSVQPRAQARRLREQSAGNDNKSWASGSSSDGSASPRLHSTVSTATASRTRRSTQRSAVSPARSVQIQTMKKNYDRFGATRLARECTRSPANFDAVVAAYEEHPDQLDQKDFAGYAPVQKAALAGNLRVVKYLIAKGCRVHTHADNGDTPLIDATENGHVDIVRLLLSHGVNPHHANNSGARAIDTIKRNDDKSDESVEAAEQIEQILKKAMREHENNGYDSDTAGGVRSREDNKKADRQDLLYLESNISNLRKYSSQGDYQAVNQFLMGGVAPDTQSAVNAARAGHEDVLNLLIANPSFKGERDPDPVKTHDETPLIAAIGRGHIGIIQILINQDGFNPSRRTSEGKTYWELAETRRGPKWQTEHELLQAKYEEWKLRRRAERKRRLESHPSEKAGKSQKLSSPESPKLKHRPQRLASPPSSDKKRLSDKNAQVKLKQQDRSDGLSAAPASVRKPSSETVAERKQTKDAGAHQSKLRKRRIVDDEEESDGERPNGSAPGSTITLGQRSSATPRNTSPTIIKIRKGSSGGQSRPEEAVSKRERRLSTSKSKKVERSRDQDLRPVDEEMSDVSEQPLLKAPAKEHTPDSLRLQRITDSERMADQDRLAGEGKRLMKYQQASDAMLQQWTRRTNQLPLAIRHACKYGQNRPLYFKGSEMGIAMLFLPVYTVTREQIDPKCPPERQSECWMPSFQAVGVLGFKELDLSLVGTARAWEKIPFTESTRARFLAAYDVSQLAYVYQSEGKNGHERFVDGDSNSIPLAKESFREMNPLCWVKFADFAEAVAEESWLKGLKITTKPIHLASRAEIEAVGSIEDVLRSLKGLPKSEPQQHEVTAETGGNVADKPSAPVVSGTVSVEMTDAPG